MNNTAESVCKVSFLFWMLNPDNWQRDEEEMKAAMIWFYRRMWKNSWIARRTNRKILQRPEGNWDLMIVIMKKYVVFHAHLLRNSRLEKDCLVVKGQERRAGGRRRRKLNDTEVIGYERMEEVLRLVENRRA